jgi:hypothetical protein
MKGKVIDKSLENYGQVIDVVLNKYMGKYTDGVKTYPKDSISFDNVDEVDSNKPVNKELNELAFRVLLAKESATTEKSTGEQITQDIDYAFGVAKMFQIHAGWVQENERRERELKANPCEDECCCKPLNVEEVPTEEVAKKKEEATNKRGKKPAPAEQKPAEEEEKGLNDYLAELGE